jgi:DNA polymerase (family 10)
MTNTEIADIFDRIANLLEIKGEIIYKILAYRRAAESIRILSSDLSEFSKKEVLGISGIGPALAQKIQELLTSGKLVFLKELESEVPPTLIELLKVQDLGPKKAALFWKQAGITSLAELEQAARANKLSSLPGMGIKSQAHILSGIEVLKQEKKRLPIDKVLTIAEKWLEKIQRLEGLKNVEISGSLRRWKPTIGDLDFVGASDNSTQVMQGFIALNGIKQILSQGNNKTSIVTEEGLNLQLWLQPPERFGSLLQFVTGSKEHNVRLREFSFKKGLSLSERGFVDQDLKETLCPEETDVYQNLGLSYIFPEMREDRGEIQAAIKNELPTLISIKDIRADLHVHTDWTDARASMEDMVQAAIKRGLKVLAITDHSIATNGVNGLNEIRLKEQAVEFQKLQEKYSNDITLLHGIEAEILEDGSLDLSEESLSKLDIVVASLHEFLYQPRKVITTRLVKAICNPKVDIIAHPGGRELPRTHGADLNWDEVFNAARENQVALEINCNPVHLDMDEVHTRGASESGVLISIDTDSHAMHKFENLKYGLSIARRAWVNKQSVINTWSTEKIVDWLKKRK